MEKTYFYDSDLYGGSYDYISSCISLNANKEDIDKFSMFWNDKISNINNKEEENECFLNLLADLSLKARDLKSFDITFVVSNTEYFDFMYLISTLSQKSNVKIDVSDIPGLFHAWESMGMTALIDNANSMREIRIVVLKYLRSSNPQPIGFSGILLAKRQNSFYCTYFLHNRNVADTKSPYPIKRLEVIRWFNQKSMVFNQSLS